MEVSVCGLKCEECQFYKFSCSGCYLIEGKTFWAKDALPNDICILFDCAINDKNYKNCGYCDELPCEKFKELKDPNITEDQHIKGIEERVSFLKSF